MWWKKLPKQSLWTPIFFLIVGCFQVNGQQSVQANEQQSIQATAQQSFRLEDLVRLSLAENYQIQIVRKQQEMAENLNTAGNAGLLPVIGLGADRNWNVETSEARLFTGATRSGENARSARFNAFVAADWVVFDGFSMFARRDRLGLLAEMGELETRYYIDQTVADLARAYYRLIMEQRLLESSRDLLEISAFRLNLETRRMQLGSGDALQFHQARVDFNADSALVVARKQNIKELQIQINRLVQREPDIPVQTAEADITLNGISSVAELVDRAVASNRDLEFARLEEMLADADYRIERGGRYPQVSLFGDYAFTRQRSELGIVESSEARGTQLGLRVRFNLFDGGRQNTRIRNAALEQENRVIQESDVRSLIHSEAYRLVSRYTAHMEQLRLLRSSIEAAERSLNIAREQLQTGAINGYEFRQTQLSVLQLENQLIELQYAMKAIEIDLDRITGTLIHRIL
jgi:outer membrane protein